MELRDGSKGAFAGRWNELCFSLMNGHRQTTPTCPFCADFVEELGAYSWRRSNGPARRRRGGADRTSGRRGSGEPLRSAAVPSECRSRCQPATCGQAVRDQLNRRTVRLQQPSFPTKSAMSGRSIQRSAVIRRIQTNKSAKIVKIPICATSQQIGRTPGGAKA